MKTNAQHKWLPFLIGIFIFSGLHKAANAQIGLGITTPHPNAYFQVNSTNKGVLLPRMTAVQRIAIAPAASANGLLVFDTDSSAYFFWTGSLWQKVGSSGSNYWTQSGNHIFNNNSGWVGIGTSSPQTRLHVADSPVLFTGPVFINELAHLTAGVEAPGIKLLWYPQRAAFRVGQTSGNQLTRDSVGPFSFAAGYDNKSVNYYAFSAGVENRAGGMAAAAIGQLNRATGNGAMALGIYNDAQGDATLAAGQMNTAYGMYSTTIGYYNKTTGQGSVALGTEELVSGTYSVAMGTGNTVSGNYSTAIGWQNLNQGSRSFVYGYSNHNYGDYAILNGYDNTNNANYSIVSGMMNRTETSSADFSFVMGMGSKSENQFGWAFGNTAIAKNEYSIAHGNHVTAQGNGAMAIGNNCSTQQTYGVAIGNNSSSTGEYGFAYGYNSTTEARGIAMGYEDTAHYSSIAIGQRATSDFYGIALGFNAFARGSNTIAIGTGQTTIFSHDCTLLGWNNQVNGNTSSAIGNNLTVNGSNSGAWGANSTVTGSNLFSLGKDNNLSGGDGTAIGKQNQLDGYTSTVIGIGSTLTASNSGILGNGNSITGDQSYAIGNRNHISYGNNSFSIGTDLEVSGNYSFAIGRYNDNSLANMNNPIFQIGNGDGFMRSNALTVLENGNIGVGILDPQEKLHVAGNISTYSLAGVATRIIAADPNGTLVPVGAGINGQVLTLIGGNPQWSSQSGWLTNGNSSTNPAINFIGTIDATDFVIRTSNAERVRISSSGNLGIGTNAPSQKLDVQGGNARINNSYIGDVGHGSTWAGFAHNNQANTTGYALLSSNDGNFTLINKKNTGLGYIGFRISNTDVAVISNAGKMGIGTTNPSNQLEVVGGPSAAPVLATIANKGGFGPSGIEFVSDYGFGSQWRPGLIRSNDVGGFTGSVEIYTNGTGSGSLYSTVKGLEVRNGVTYTASGTVSSWSDARLKSNIQPFTSGLDVIQKINPVRFQYRENAPFATQDIQIGVIAQELEQVAPYMVSKHHTGTASDLRSVNNQAYVFLLINAIKEQQQQIEQQQTQLTEQQKINLRLQQQLDELKLALQQR